MILFLSKILPLFVYPVGLVSLLLLVSLLSGKKQRLQKALVLSALLVLSLASNTWAANLLVSSLESRFPAPEEVPEAEIILVLGGGTEPPSSPRQMVEMNGAGDRMLYAAHLYQEGKAPLLLLSGGSIPWKNAGMSAADQMAAVFEIMGVPREKLILEETSRNTYENALACAPILQERGIDRVILVTSAIHMPRAAASFEKQGIEIIPAPVDYLVTELDRFQPENFSWEYILINSLPSVGNLSYTSSACKEYLGMIIYALRGWI